MAQRPKWLVSIEDAHDPERGLRRSFKSEAEAYAFAAGVVAEEAQAMLEAFDWNEDEAGYLKDIVDMAKGPDLRSWANAVDEYAAEDLGPYDVKVDVEEVR